MDVLRSELEIPRLRRIFVAGVAAAAVDGAYFSIMAEATDRTVTSVLESIAAFWISPRAFDSSWQAPALGLVTHVALATLMAAGFALLSRLVRLPRSTFLTGSAYGLALYLIMYLAVLPLRWPALYPRFDGWRSIADIAAHLAVGLVIARLLTPMARTGRETLG